MAIVSNKSKFFFFFADWSRRDPDDAADFLFLLSGLIKKGRKKNFLPQSLTVSVHVQGAELVT